MPTALRPAWLKLETTPSVVIRPTVALYASTNQRSPSGPTVMAPGLSIEGSVNFVTVPVGVTRSMLEGPSVANPGCSLTQRLPSGPAAMPASWPRNVPTKWLVITPVGVICPIDELLANQRSPSGPEVIAWLVMPVATIEGCPTGVVASATCTGVPMSSVAKVNATVVTTASTRGVRPISRTDPSAADPRRGRAEHTEREVRRPRLDRLDKAGGKIGTWT